MQNCALTHAADLPSYLASSAAQREAAAAAGLKDYKHGKSHHVPRFLTSPHALGLLYANSVHLKGHAFRTNHDPQGNANEASSFSVSAIALICKYATKGWEEVQVAYSNKENSEEVAKVLSYLEVVEKVKHSCDETELINLIEEHKLEREQLLTDHLKSKQVSVFGVCGRITVALFFRNMWLFL